MVSAFSSPKLLERMLEPEESTSSFRDHVRSPDTSMSHEDIVGDSHNKSDLGETTEDEEVKVNCVGGVQSYMTTSEEEEVDDDESTGKISDDEDNDDNAEGVVTFVSRPQSRQLICPQPVLGAVAEGEEDDGSDASHMQVAQLDHDESLDADDESSLEDMNREMDEDSDAESEQEGELLSDHEDDDDSVVSAILHETSRILEEPPSTIYDFGSSIQSGTQLFDDSESSPEDADETEDAVNTKVVPTSNSTLVSPEMTSPCGLKRIMSPINLGDNMVPPKRMRCSLSSYSPTSLPMSRFETREMMVSPSSIESENDMDKQLGEELLESDLSSERESTPVPLLSPPPSPLCVESDKGHMTTVCEWPYNLAVDSALTAIYCLRPPSPNSLARLAEEEEDRCMGSSGFAPMLPTISD